VGTIISTFAPDNAEAVPSPPAKKKKFRFVGPPIIKVLDAAASAALEASRQSSLLSAKALVSSHKGM
jgi:hypothetical protein